MGDQLFGYGSLPKASYQQLPLLLPGVRNCVVELCDVQPGEKVTIVAEETVDPVVVEAFRTVCSSIRGVDVNTLFSKPFSPAGIDPDNPSDVVVQAYAASDSVFILSWYPDIHSRKLPPHASEIYHNKAVSLYQLATFDVLSSPAAHFPLPVMYEVMRRMRLMVAGKQIRVTDERGTDMLLYAGEVERIFGGIGSGVAEKGPGKLRPGMRAHFPPSTCGFLPLRAKGVFVPSETIITGAPREPIRITVEDDYVTNIQGGAEAEALAAFIHGPEASAGPKRLCECMWGLNPKARLKGANATMVEKERRAGELHFGIATYKYGVGTSGWVSHVDCYLSEPKIWIDGNLVFDRGRFALLEDPDIRALAREFGDPDEILKPGQPMDFITC